MKRDRTHRKDRYKMGTILRAVFASALGALAGTWIAHDIVPTIWPVGCLLGGALGWIMFGPKEFWQEFWKKYQDLQEFPWKNYFRYMRASLPLVLLVSTPITVLMGMVSLGNEIITKLFDAQGPESNLNLELILTFVPFLGMFLFLVMGAHLEYLQKQEKQGGEIGIDESGIKRKWIFGIPVLCNPMTARYLAPIVLALICVALVCALFYGMYRGAKRLYKESSKILHALADAAKQVHSHGREICFVSATLGAGIGHFSGGRGFIGMNAGACVAGLIIVAAMLAEATLLACAKPKPAKV